MFLLFMLGDCQKLVYKIGRRCVYETGLVRNHFVQFAFK